MRGDGHGTDGWDGQDDGTHGTDSDWIVAPCTTNSRRGSCLAARIEQSPRRRGIAAGLRQLWSGCALAPIASNGQSIAESGCLVVSSRSVYVEASRTKRILLSYNHSRLRVTQVSAAKRLCSTNARHLQPDFLLVVLLYSILSL